LAEFRGIGRVHCTSRRVTVVKLLLTLCVVWGFIQFRPIVTWATTVASDTVTSAVRSRPTARYRPWSIYDLFPRSCFYFKFRQLILWLKLIQGPLVDTISESIDVVTRSEFVPAIDWLVGDKSEQVQSALFIDRVSAQKPPVSR